MASSPDTSITSAPWSTAPISAATLLADLPDDIKSSFLGLARRTEIPTNSRLCTQGEKAGHLFLVNKGKISYSHLTHDGRQTILFWFQPGDSFGLGTMLAQPHPYIGSATSVSPCQIFSWDHDSLHDFVLRHPELACNAVAVALHYFSLLAGRHSDVLGGTARNRVAKALLKLSQDRGCAQQANGIGTQSDGIDVQITNEQLASLADVSPFTVCRVLSDWERRGALKKRRMSVQVLAPEELLPYAR